MSKSVEDYDSLWKLLRSSGFKSSSELEIPSFPLDVGTSSGKLRLAIDEHNQLMLLVPIEMTAKTGEETATAGLDVGTRVFAAPTGKTRFIFVSCVNAALEAVFSKLAGDIVNRINGGNNAVSAIAESISDFRRLLERLTQRSVDREQVIGLIGELLFLDAIMDLNSSAWKSWLGYLGARHDFLNGNTAIEVKTSMRAHKPIVSVHAIDQLEAPNNGTLYLVHYILEDNPAGALAVSTLAEKLIKQAGDADLGKRFLAMGFDIHYTEAWEHHRFTLKEMAMYRVEEAFPRIIRSMLKDESEPAGVSHITYKVDLAQARKYLVDEAGYDIVYKKIAEVL